MAAGKWIHWGPLRDSVSGGRHRRTSLGFCPSRTRSGCPKSTACRWLVGLVAQMLRATWKTKGSKPQGVHLLSMFDV